MATFKLEISCDNDAFYNPEGNFDPTAEVASILERVCSHNLRMGNENPMRLYDTNGHIVGNAYFDLDCVKL